MGAKRKPKFDPDEKLDFPMFFAVYALQKGWEVPDFHIRICRWLEKSGRIKVLQVFVVLVSLRLRLFMRHGSSIETRNIGS